MGRDRTSRTARTALVLSLASGLAVSLAACGTPASTGASVPAPPPPPTPSATDYVTGVLRTRDLGTARTRIEVTTTRGTVTTELNGLGGVAFANGHGGSGFGEITWTAADGADTVERSNGKGLFIQADPTDGVWTRYESAGQTATGRLTDVLRGLGTLQGVRSEGPDRLGELPVTRYAGHLPITAEALGQLGLSAKESEALAATAGSSVIDVTVYLDEGGRVVGVDRAVDISGERPVRSLVRTRLGDFSAPFDFSPPASESVVSASGKRTSE